MAFAPRLQSAFGNLGHSSFVLRPGTRFGDSLRSDLCTIATCRVGHLDRCCSDIENIELVGKRLHHNAYVIEIAFQQPLAKGSAREVQPVRPQVGQPLPRQTKQLMSYSADGSVKGK